jgi:hypothetical protein
MCMQLLSAAKRHFTIASQIISNYFYMFERMLWLMMWHVVVSTGSREERSEHLLQIYSFCHNSQTFPDACCFGYFSYFRMWQSSPKFVRIFQLPPVYRDWALTRPHLRTLEDVENISTHEIKRQPETNCFNEFIYLNHLFITRSYQWKSQFGKFHDRFKV